MPARLANTSAPRRSSSVKRLDDIASTPRTRPSGAWTGTDNSDEATYHSHVWRACSGGSCSSSRRLRPGAPGHSSMPATSSGARRSIAASVIPARSGSYGRLSTAPKASPTSGVENQAAAGRMYRSSQSTIRKAQPVRSKARLSWATICSRVWLRPCVEMSAGAWIVVVGDLLEELQRRRLRRRGAHLTAPEILQLREEGRMDRDLLRARVLEDDDRPARDPAVTGGRFADRGTGRRQHRDRELAPVREGVLTLGGVHLRQVVVVALGQRGDRCLERRLGEQVVGSGHVASMARRPGRRARPPYPDVVDATSRSSAARSASGIATGRRDVRSTNTCTNQPVAATPPSAPNRPIS